MVQSSKKRSGGSKVKDVDLVDRHRILTAMLGGTGRGGVPLRSEFIQLREPDSSGSRVSRLASFTTDPRSLDAYLLIHALASAKAPHEASYPGLVWAHSAGFTITASQTSARQQWSKAVGKLTKLELITAGRDKRQAVYTLLDERGDGEPYTRPTKIEHGGWVTIPHAYWLDGWDQKLTLAQKLMLLISLDQKQKFELPTNRVQEWYGVSKSTAVRGFDGLRDHGILDADKRTTIDLSTKAMIRTVNVYTTLGIWTKANRAKTMTIKRRRRRRTAPPEISPS
ncbi:hypothetical protein [Microbacterium sp. BH-3-3-3]|uniref:hypothetical protein n=1 Tax=Microbacterium sp. BH-3-3-3 TaxID=1906742 RepID=UPI0011A48B5F|nr:hypothetical protein [Microbacterium sp. BH-3-3-3]